MPELVENGLVLENQHYWGNLQQKMARALLMVAVA